MLVELGSVVDVCRLDGVEEQFSDADAFNVDEVRLEKGLWSSEALASHLDHPAIWKLWWSVVVLYRVLWGCIGCCGVV